MRIFHEIYVLLRLAGLHFFGLFGRAGVPVLIGGLNEVDQRIVKLAEEKIRRMGDKATPDLIKALRYKHSVVPRRVARLLKHTGAETIEPLTELLNYDSEIDRRDAIHTLGTLKPYTQKAIASLIEALEDPALSVRKQAKATLAGMGAPALCMLLERLAACAETERELAYQISDTVIGFKKDAVPGLIGFIKGEDQAVRYFAMRSLKLIGGEAIPEVIELLKHESVRIRETAAKTLEMMDRKAKVAIPALMNLLNDPDENVRFRAGFALGVIGADPSIFAPVLEKLTPPMVGKYEAFNLYHPHSIERAHITEKHPIFGEIMYDRLGLRFLCPEEDYRGGDGGCIELKGAVIRTAHYAGDWVKISGFYEKGTGLVVTAVTDEDRSEDRSF